jgi:hypothetical protein
VKYRAADHISVREWLAFVAIFSIVPLLVAAVIAIVIRVLKGFSPVASAAPYPRVWAGIPACRKNQPAHSRRRSTSTIPTSTSSSSSPWTNSHRNFATKEKTP